MVKGFRDESHPNRQVGRERWTPPGGASASGLMRQSGIGQFDQGAPGEQPRTWGTPLDPTSGQIPGWEPGEAWPPLHTAGDTYIPDTNSPGEYISGDSDISVGVSVQPSNAPAPGSIPLQQFPGTGEGLYSVPPKEPPDGT